jgi:hypothetical protein
MAIEDQIAVQMADLSLFTRADDSGRDLYTIARLPQTSIGRAMVSIYKEKHNYISSYSPA